MTDQSERIRVEDLYLRALGRATYNFACLEWGIVWLTETLEPGFLREVANLTAGQIARRFGQAVEQMASIEPDKSQLNELVSVFGDLVEDRNRLMHGNPFTANGGEQRLLYDGRHGRKDWTVESIQDFASRAAAASVKAGGTLHNGRYQVYESRSL